MVNLYKCLRSQGLIIFVLSTYMHSEFSNFNIFMNKYKHNSICTNSGNRKYHVDNNFFLNMFLYVNSYL